MFLVSSFAEVRKVLSVSVSGIDIWVAFDDDDDNDDNELT